MPSRSGGTGGGAKGSMTEKPQAIMVDGQRYTCEKCKKGHRTGTCNHLEDENGQPSLLQKTNRAGRPNTGSICKCPSKDSCSCSKTWYLIVRIPKSELEPGREQENNCRIVRTVTKPLREGTSPPNYGGSLIAASMNSSDHQCNCGDKCACTYCPAHPENQATHDHNQFLANQTRSVNSMANPHQHVIEQSSESCVGPAEVSYASFSADTEFGQQQMLAQIPLNDQNNHYQVYSGQYPQTGCPSTCRCPGCITYRVDPLVKQQLAMEGSVHEDCPVKCNCTGCWSHRVRNGVVEYPILTREEFYFMPPQSTPLPPTFTSPGHMNVYHQAPMTSPEISMVPATPMSTISRNSVYMPTSRYTYAPPPDPVSPTDGLTSPYPLVDLDPSLDTSMPPEYFSPSTMNSYP